MLNQQFQPGDEVKFFDDYDGFSGVAVVDRVGTYPEGRVFLSGLYYPPAHLRQRFIRLDHRKDHIEHHVPSVNPSAEALQATPETADNPKKRFGATKPDLALVPPVGTLHQAMSHELGAFKYGAFNWRTSPVEAMTYIGAIERHIQAYKDGEEYSSDSEGMCHNLGAIMASCAILLDSMELGILKDNRPKPGMASAVQTRLQGLKVAQAKRRAPTNG